MKRNVHITIARGFLFGTKCITTLEFFLFLTFRGVFYNTLFFSIWKGWLGRQGWSMLVGGTWEFDRDWDGLGWDGANLLVGEIWGLGRHTRLTFDTCSLA